MYGNKKLIIIGGAVILALLIGFGLFFILRGGGRDRGGDVGTEQGSSKRDNMLILARDYADQGEYQMALDLLNQLLIEDAADEDARELRDEVLAAKKAEGEASKQAELDALREQNEQLAESLDRLGDTFNQENPVDRAAIERAEEVRRRREEAQKQEVESLVARGRRALAEGRYDDAVDDANAALRIIPDSSAARTLKSDAEKARRDAESGAERQAREERERELSKLLTDARRAVENGRYTEARDLAAKAREIDPESGEAWAVEGDAWYLADPGSGENRRRARNAYESALRHNPEDWNAHYRLGQIAAAEGDLGEAIDSFQRAASLNPGMADIWYELGKAQFRDRRYADAVGSFEKVNGIRDDYPNNWFNLGLSYSRIGKTSDSARSFAQSLKVQPDHAASHYEMGKINLVLENWSAAADSFTMAANLAPGKSQYWRSLGAAYYGKGSYSDARTAYGKALNLEPTHGNTLYNLALIALKLEDVDDALTKAAGAVRSDGSNAAYLYTLGQAAEKAGMNDQAVTSYRKAASLDPNYSKPRINLGVIYDKRGDFDQALEYLLQALRIEPNSPTVWNNLGKAYLHKGDYTNSLSFFEKAASAAPNDVELQMNYALALTETGAMDRAEVAYDRVISLDSTRGDAYDFLARLQISSDNTSGAKTTIAALERAVPGYPGLADLKALVQ